MLLWKKISMVKGKLICGEILSQRFKSLLVSISFAFGVSYINVHVMGWISVEFKGLKCYCYLKTTQCLKFEEC